MGPDPVHVVQVLTAFDGTIHSIEEYIASQRFDTGHSPSLR
jgi:hypothetical protein